ncbi:MAG: hypothetical protein AAF214_07125 [Pseudomonadota bacterium]
MAEAETKSKETPTTETAPKTGKRAAKLQKLKKAETFNFAIDADVRAYLTQAAHDQGLDLSHLMQKIVEGYVVETAPADTALSVRLAAKRSVIDAVQKTATDMDTAGKFDDHFILNVIKASSADAAFVTAYETATAAEGDTNKAKVKARRTRTALNQQLGRVIKRTVGARSVRKEGGGTARSSAADALITTYTLLAKPA